MKKLLLMLLFIIPVALAAGQTINLDDFSKSQLQIVTLGERDRMAFNMLEGEHTIIIDKILNSSADLSIFPYLKDNMFLTITSKKYIKLDLNRDHIIDLIIRLENINGKNVTLSIEKVSIDERTIMEKKYNISYYNTTSQYSGKNESKAYTVGILAVIFVIIILSLIPRRIYKNIYRRFRK